MPEKSQSPFYPGQPVPVELFVGRDEQIDRILTRGVGQVERGKPVAVYVQGEYGIGKSSLARYLQFLAAEKHGLLPIYASFSPSQTPTDLAIRLVEATMHSGSIHPSRGERVRAWLAKYIGKQELFGFSINLEVLKKDAPTIASVHGLLDFLRGAYEKAKPATSGVFLVLDEINGLAGQGWFSQLVKSLVDTNALAVDPLPLLLMICGTEDRRRQMIQGHEPIERVFDVVDIELMSSGEMREFFHRAFEAAAMTVDEDAMELLVRFSAGFPKIMHLVGDWAYWTDQDQRIDGDDAIAAAVDAAEDFGKKYVDQQVLAALRSTDYRSILAEIATHHGESFSKKDVEKALDDSERKKLGNFLQKMKTLGVLRAGDAAGQYTFSMKLVWLYLRIKGAERLTRGVRPRAKP